MISKNSFSLEHILSLRNIYHLDPILLERVIFAFGLLESLKKVKLPFIFKGGTCLMLLLDKPMRLSTDIDIIIENTINIESYINKIADIYPFKSVEEQNRIGKNNIEKRHFKFTYVSPINDNEIYILLDVLIEKNNYNLLIEKEIKNDLLISEGNNYSVLIPSIDCILADKLTAFAPHTIGISIKSDKYMEIMKQMFDIICLIEHIDKYTDFIDSYNKIAKQEIAYCGVPINVNDVLLDTIEVSKNIISRGAFDSEEYKIYVSGMRSLKSHLFDSHFSANTAAVKLPKILYLATCALKRQEYKDLVEFQKYKSISFINKDFSSLKYLKKVNLEAYGYCIETEKLLIS